MHINYHFSVTGQASSDIPTIVGIDIPALFLLLLYLSEEKLHSAGSCRLSFAGTSYATLSTLAQLYIYRCCIINFIAAAH